jgi:hypothetical protein
VYAYFYQIVSGSVPTFISLTNMVCNYYRVTSYNNVRYLWQAFYYSVNSPTLNQLALQVPDSLLGASNANVNKWMGCTLSGCGCGTCATTVLFPTNGMQNGLGSVTTAPYYGTELVYSGGILNLANQYSKWEVNRNIYSTATNGISALGITTAGTFSSSVVFGVRLTGSLWF